MFNAKQLQCSVVHSFMIIIEMKAVIVYSVIIDNYTISIYLMWPIIQCNNNNNNIRLTMILKITIIIIIITVTPLYNNNTNSDHYKSNLF